MAASWVDTENQLRIFVATKRPYSCLAQGLAQADSLHLGLRTIRRTNDRLGIIVSSILI
jgi:hypothetical protein